MSTIVVYAGGSNTTAVAEYIATKTSGKAMTASAAASEDLSSYDTIVIGGRVHAGKLPKDIVEYVAKNKDVISQKKSGFYVCCMYNDEKGQTQSDRLAASLGITNHIFINKAKKVVANDPKIIDDFIASL